MIDILTVETPSLGDRSYVVTDGEVAVVVDPQRDTDRVLALTEPRGLRITHVLETHIHNDYVTGGYALAREVGARYCVNAEDPVSYERHPVRDGDVLETGRLRIRAIATPGHTYTHLSYVVEDAIAGPAQDAPAVFTGGSLLYGSTGRPDLLGPDHTHALAHHQHASAHRLAAELPGETGVFPTHGFGSFCSASQSEGTSSTIAHERRSNPALTQDEEAFVAQMLAGLDAFPAYYAHMGPANARGPEPGDLTAPELADPVELRRRIEAGEWVVDLRNRTAFAAGHVAGTLNFGLDGQFVTYLGWLIPWGTPVTLLAETAEEVDAAQRDLLRIGIDRPAAAATGKPSEWAGEEPLATFPTATFADLARQRADGADPYVLDLRRDDERRDGIITGTEHLPLHALLRRLGEVPTDRAVWVHCAAGYRASVAASVLDRAGVAVVAVDDDFANAAKAGLAVSA